MTSVKEIDLKIRETLDTNTLCYYLYDVSQILNDYNSLLETPIKMSFTGKNSNNTNGKIKEISIKYFTLAQKYTTDILKIPLIKKTTLCASCKEADFEVVNNIFTCINCGLENFRGIQTLVSDTSCINIQTKQIYSRLDTFNVVLETFPFNKDFNLITVLIKDFKLLDRLFTKIFYDKNFVYMPFVVYKLLQKHNYIFLEKITKKIRNKKSDILQTCFCKLNWTYHQ